METEDEDKVDLARLTPNMETVSSTKPDSKPVELHWSHQASVLLTAAGITKMGAGSVLVPAPRASVALSASAGIAKSVAKIRKEGTTDKSRSFPVPRPALRPGQDN